MLGLPHIKIKVKSACSMKHKFSFNYHRDVEEIGEAGTRALVRGRLRRRLQSAALRERVPAAQTLQVRQPEGSGFHGRQRHLQRLVLQDPLAGHSRWLARVRHAHRQSSQRIVSNSCAC